VIRLGIVGSNFGCAVLLPAFRTDPRCEVVALAGSDPARTQERAREHNIPKSYDRWEDLIADTGIEAVAIATPPDIQPNVAIAAIESGKAVFAEKPLALDFDVARDVRKAVQKSGKAFAIDFEFPELPAWRKAKEMLEGDAIGPLRHLSVAWHIETYATKMRLKSWRTAHAPSGGAVGNFVSHCLHYMEHFCGPIRTMSANMLTPLDAREIESGATLNGSFENGAGYTLTMNADAYLGPGHRIELYGKDGTLILNNQTADHARGFTLHHARRPATELSLVPVSEEGLNLPDGRIAPVARIVRRFLDSIETRAVTKPGLAEAYRVQTLIAAARFSKTIGSKEIELQEFERERQQ
jgi:predicted dehydrogenase